MSRVNPVIEVMHRIKVKLYPGYLPGIKGSYIARTGPEALLGIDEVGAFLKNRGGYTGSYEDVIKNVQLWFDEAMYLLCNGFAVNTGYFSIHPSVGGVFSAENEPFDPQQHPISFTFRVRGKLRRLVEFITVEIEGIADVAGYIDEFRDVDEESINTLYAPGSQFVISGHRLKVAGGSPVCGVYFVPVDAPSKAVKVARLAENTPTKIIGKAPQTGYQSNRIEIRTQYAGAANNFLKVPRSIMSGFVLEEIEV